METSKKIPLWTQGLSCATILMTLVGCSGHTSGSGYGNPHQQQQQQQQAVEGVYQAKLTALNPKIAKFASGTAIVTHTGDNFTVSVNVNNAPSGIHPQHIHLGSCPSLANDTNGDGYLDDAEADPVAGKIIVPLDADLDAQDLGKDLWPGGRTYGYHRNASYSRLLGDLHQPQTDATLAKLDANQELSLEGKIIEVHGAAMDLPPTVKGSDGLSAEMITPIACGVLTRVP